jgi:hypothetical protein
MSQNSIHGRSRARIKQQMLDTNAKHKQSTNLGLDSTARQADHAPALLSAVTERRQLGTLGDGSARPPEMAGVLLRLDLLLPGAARLPRPPSRSSW